MITAENRSAEAVAYRRVRHLALRRVADETVVMDLRRRVIFGVNDAAAWLLSNLDHPRTTDRLARRLQIVGADPRTALAQLEGFLAELVAHGLLEASPDPTGDEPEPPPPLVSSAAPAVLWREQLELVTHAPSPSNRIGIDPQCSQ